MFNRLVEGARLAADGLFGDRFGFFELLDRAGKLPRDLDSYVDSRLTIRRPVAAVAAVAAAPAVDFEPLREAA